MKFHLVSLMPQFFEESLQWGVLGRAIKNDILGYETHNPRKHTSDVHQTVDDRPYGGGEGMVMMAEPLEKTMEEIGESRGRVVHLSPQGKSWNHEMAREWAKSETNITLICGRYAGIDQRFLNKYVDEEVSLGDFVLSGGEPAALVVMDSVARFLPGTLGNELSAETESFAIGGLESPMFTRPAQWNESLVPSILLSGDHKKIEEFKGHLARVTTACKRPDLLLREKNFRENLKFSTEYLLNLSDEELDSCGVKKEDLEALL